MVFEVEDRSRRPRDPSRWMDEGMSRLRFILVCFVPLVGGCISTSTMSKSAIGSTSQPRFLAELDTIDTIQIDELTLDKRRDVKRFIETCRNARWAPYTATMPAQAEAVTLMSEGVELHQLLYAGGWLFDTTGESATHFGTIHADDGAWFDENIDKKLMLLRDAL